MLTFLDAHVECTRGWLEPLLHRISEDRSTIVCPAIDHIDLNSMEYVTMPITWIGFHWYLQLDWDPAFHENFDEFRENKTAPFPTPMMIGCAFSVDRDFFYEIGSYDEGMDIWGAENLEISFRVRTHILLFNKVFY